MYEVRAKRLENTDGNLIGIASFVVDGQFAFNGIRVLKSDNTERGFFLSMPSFKLGEKYIDYFHPISSAMANNLANAVSRAIDSGVTIKIGNEPSKIGLNIEVNDDPKNKARVTMKIDDDFICDSIHVVEGSKGLFVSMPSYKSKEGEYKDYCHPITAEYKAGLDSDIMALYNAVKTVRDNMDNRKSNPNATVPGFDSSKTGFEIIGETNVAEDTPFVEGEEPTLVSDGKSNNKPDEKTGKEEKEEEAPRKGRKR